MTQPQPVIPKIRAIVVDDEELGRDRLQSLLGEQPDVEIVGVCADGPSAVEMVERAQRGGKLIRIDLAPLTLDQAHELLAGAADADALYAESGGNPFYLEQLARSPARDGGGVWSEGSRETVGGIAVPAAVAAALAEELHLLAPEARAVLQGAAVAGDPFDPELAAAAAATDEQTAIAALDVLLDSVRACEIRPAETTSA